MTVLIKKASRMDNFNLNMNENCRILTATFNQNSIVAKIRCQTPNHISLVLTPDKMGLSKLAPSKNRTQFTKCPLIIQGIKY